MDETPSVMGWVLRINLAYSCTIGINHMTKQSIIPHGRSPTFRPLQMVRCNRTEPPQNESSSLWREINEDHVSCRCRRPRPWHRTPVRRHRGAGQHRARLSTTSAGPSYQSASSCSGRAAQTVQMPRPTPTSSSGHRQRARRIPAGSPSSTCRARSCPPSAVVLRTPEPTQKHRSSRPIISNSVCLIIQQTQAIILR